MQLVLISGLSGSGKSVALRVLEDCGHYCVDNMPAAMLPTLATMLANDGHERAAVAIDARSGDGIRILPQQVAALRAAGHAITFLFLEAQDAVLIQRFSETRRRHPLAVASRTLVEAIAEERVVLAPIANLGSKIDTSHLRASALREWVVQSCTDLTADAALTLIFQSFGFKHGLPLDADLVFDARCLPNPYYDSRLRPLTGLDAAVGEWLQAEASVLRMRDDIARFVGDWLPAYRRDTRAYLSVAIGCTGGQHRSVYLAEALAEIFRPEVPRVLVRHRRLTGS